MNKKPDWEQCLHDFLTSNKDTKFSWGAWDCCVFVDSATKAMTGSHVIPEFIEWGDKKAALQTIRKYSGNLTGCVNKAALSAGMTEVLPSDAMKGDLVVYTSEGNDGAGIYDGYAIAAPSDDGLARKRKDLIVKAYRANESD